MYTDKKMNLVCIFTDQQRADTMKAYGNDWIHTPNFNRLSEESAVFKKTYVSNPVCTPSRGTIMTGLYPQNHGAFDNNIPLRDDVPTVVKHAGDDYASMYDGKWHLGDEIFRQQGFDQWVSIDDQYYPHYSEDRDLNARSSYYHYLRAQGFMPDSKRDGIDKFSRKFCTRLPEEHSKTAFVGRNACEFIRQNRDHNFMLYVNFFEPHGPMYSVNDELYDPDEMPFERITKELKGEIPLKIRARMSNQPTEQELKEKAARYFGMVTLVDKYLGEILDTIEDCGLKEDTLVVFTSDHGDMLGDFGMTAKQLMYPSSACVPFLIRIPGVTDEGRSPVIESPVSLIDLVPTILDVMDITPKRELDGESLLPVIRGEDELERDIFVEWNGRYGEIEVDDEKGLDISWRSVVTTDGWRLTLREEGIHQLINQNEDPDETTNLYYDDAYREKREELTEKILNWQKEVGDELTLDI